MRFLKLPLIVCLLCIYASCKKDSNSLDLTPSFYFLNGDTSSLSKTLILFSSSDTVTFNVIVSSTYLLPKDAVVTIAAADTARNSYNLSHGTSYQAMPAAAYSFQTTFTATTSSVSPSIYDTIPVTIHKSALNPAISYMLPISIISASGNKITTGPSVIYLNTINNKLTGVYNASGIKIMYNGSAADSNVNAKDTFTLVKSIVPSSHTNVSQLDYADLGSNGWKYYLSFLSDTGYAFTVGANEVILNSVQSGSFKILTSTYDSTTNNIFIKSTYKNLSGDERIIEESLKLY